MISDDLRHFLSALLLVVGGLLPIVNPVGSAPMFLAMTRGADLADAPGAGAQDRDQHIRAHHGLADLRSYVLKIFGLSVPVVQVAGGAVLCALGWNLLHQDTRARDHRCADGYEQGLMRAFTRSRCR